jgi:hypothetical protein
MLQITPQMKILVAVEPADFRRLRTIPAALWRSGYSGRQRHQRHGHGDSCSPTAAVHGRFWGSRGSINPGAQNPNPIANVQLPAAQPLMPPNG